MNIQLETARTLIRPSDISDLNSIHELHSLPESMEFNTLEKPRNLEETESMIKGWHSTIKAGIAGQVTFTIESNQNNEFIGLFGFNIKKPKYRSAEVWCKLIPKYWNRGYATEVLSKMIDIGFDELNLHRIESGCALNNIGSIRVFQKVGMTKEGISRQILPLKSGWSDALEFSILETDQRDGKPNSTV